MIKEIVRHIMVEVKPAPDIKIPDCVVGIDTHLSKIESFSFSDINSEEVQMIGIYGVQGIGKSVLASDFYHKHKADFEYKSLAESINDKAKEKYQIVEVQKAILSEILGETDVTVYNVEEGAKMMEDVLSCKRVLLVLDNVENELQLEKLARGCNWFGPGSRIIITTRKESLLRKHKVHFTYEMKAMDPIEALQLLSWHAFERNEPHQYSRELTNAVLSYTKGIPSALVKLGSVLSSKYVSYQHCEVDGENKQVGEMRTLVRKKLNKIFKRGQWGADSTGRLDKTLEQILREAMDDMSIQEKFSEVEREDDDSLEKEEESENSSESQEESEEESSEDQAKCMTNKPSSDSRIVAYSSQVSNGYNYEHGKELIQQNPYATNCYVFGTSREYHHNYPMTIPGYNAPPIPTYIPPIPPIPGYYPMMTPMRLGTSNEYNFCPTGESGCHCQDCAMKFSPEFRPY